MQDWKLCLSPSRSPDGEGGSAGQGALATGFRQGEEACVGSYLKPGSPGGTWFVVKSTEQT